MSGARLWTMGSVLVIIALVAGTWFIGISPLLAAAALSNDERANVEQQNLIHEATIVGLQQQFDDIDRLRVELDEMQAAIPEALDLPDLINELNRRSANAGVTVMSLTLGAATPYLPVAGTDQADPQFAAAVAALTPENLLVVPMDLAITGDYGDVMAFVSSIQGGERLVLVHDLALVTGAMASDSVAEYTLSGQLFVLTDASPAPPAGGGTEIAAPAQ